MVRVLIVDDVHDTADSLVRSLKKAGYDAIPAYSEERAYELLRQNIFDVIVTDMLMERPDSGLEVLREAKRLNSHVEVILLTGYGEVKTAVPAMNLGAFDYIEKTPGSQSEQNIYKTVLDKINLASITKKICGSLSSNEIAVLCLFLGFEYDELPRESKRDKIVHMISQLSQRNELHILKAFLWEVRPGLIGDRASIEDTDNIMCKFVKAALDRNPGIIAEVYNEALSTSAGRNGPSVPDLCETVLRKSLKEVVRRSGSTVTGDRVPALAQDTYYTSPPSNPAAPARYAFLMVDIAEHSKIVKQHKTELVNRTLDRFISFVSEEVQARGGEVWGWQGDGGLCVFRDADCEDRATLSAASIFTGMQVFNMEQNLLPVDLNISIAVHTGYVTVTGDRGSVHSEVINFVVHMEESGVEKNTICISNDVFGELSEQIKKRFLLKGTFAGKEIYVYSN